jgi:hypothetical protein
MSSGTPAVFRFASPEGLVSNWHRLAAIFAFTTLGDKPAETMEITSLLVNNSLSAETEGSEFLVGPPPPCWANRTVLNCKKTLSTKTMRIDISAPEKIRTLKFTEDGTNKNVG